MGTLVQCNSTIPEGECKGSVYRCKIRKGARTGSAWRDNKGGGSMSITAATGTFD